MAEEARQFLGSLLDRYEQDDDAPSKIVWNYFDEDKNRVYVLSDSDTSVEIFIITIQEGKIEVVE